MSVSSTAVIVVAAGSGTRLGHAEPKAFVPLGGDTILGVALHAVFGMRETPYVVVVVPSELVDETRSRYASESSAASVHVEVVAGGVTRQESVSRGLAVLPRAVDTVLVHDAARPLTPSIVFDEVAAAVRSRRRGVVPALDVVDTIKRVGEHGRVIETVDRDELAAVQTPQGFPRAALQRAYADATVEFTDDAALAASAGLAVDVVPGDTRAFKITVPADLRRAESMVAESVVGEPKGEGATDVTRRPLAGVPRVGTGVDVHALSDDVRTPLWLAGLHWPGERGLAGHSDGDAACHAICDALLAAAGLGDLGSVFGTGDARFEGAHSEVFLTETVRRLRNAGYVVGNVSVQLIGNRPKLAPRRAEAEVLLSGLLEAPVSVAATTTDALGFAGRGEGVAAIATALVVPA
ncbi:MAG: 2-C-methyl-D-erythritol 4-phosphate cytidylyltransferase [Actinomycetota bacterium]|nr:2-C-methyl-D-erythritol 4-phosphate cytidylyltransferase [Actinomycetota bacterium]